MLDTSEIRNKMYVTSQNRSIVSMNGSQHFWVSYSLAVYSASWLPHCQSILYLGGTSWQPISFPGHTPCQLISYLSVRLGGPFRNLVYHFVVTAPTFSRSGWELRLAYEGHAEERERYDGVLRRVSSSFTKTTNQSSLSQRINPIQQTKRHFFSSMFNYMCCFVPSGSGVCLSLIKMVFLYAKK